MHKEIRNNYLDELIASEQYSLEYKEKSKILLNIIKKQFLSIGSNPCIKNFLYRQHFKINSMRSLVDIPYLPVQMFKYFDLATCPPKDVVRVVKSSGTTSNLVSKVPLNKNTIINQTKALAGTISHYLGKKRKLFLVIDHEGINMPNQEISARTMGVRGLSMYANKTFFLLKEEKDGNLTLNYPVIRELIEKYKDADIYIFGFTYIIWSIFYKQMISENLCLKFKSGKLFHSGGWKKLEEKEISKDLFSKKMADIFSLHKKDVHDFYGMAEQGGVIFVDCKYGNKHVPNFATVIVRDFQTLKSCDFNITGLIQVTSTLADSYYDQAILTEDTGYIVGIDDCRCGKKGEYFRFKSRVKSAEIKGCGDTFRENNKKIQ